jgi:hypothetical protein
MATSVFHEVRLLYRTTPGSSVPEIINFHGLVHGDELLRWVSSRVSNEPCLQLCIRDFTFTKHSFVLEHCPTLRDRRVHTIQHYRLMFASHECGLVLLTDASRSPINRQSQCLPLNHRDHFALTVLCQPAMTHGSSGATVPQRVSSQAPTQINGWVDAICDVFEKNLLYRGPDGDH